MAAAPKVIRTELDHNLPLAVIFNGGEWADILADLLRSQGIEVKRDLGQDDSSKEKANYFFFFASDKIRAEELFFQMRSVTERVSWSAGKLVVIWENLEGEKKDQLKKKLRESGWPETTVELKGYFLEPEKKEVAGKILRKAFSSRNGEAEIFLATQKIGEDIQERVPTEQSIPKKKLSIQEVMDQLKEIEKKGKLSRRREGTIGGKWLKMVGIFIGVGFLALSPLLVAVSLGVLGMVGLQEVKTSLLAGKFDEGEKAAQVAQDRFSLAKDALGTGSMFSLLPGVGNYVNYFNDALNLGETAADAAKRLALIGPGVAALPGGVMGEGTIDLVATLGEIHGEIGLIDQNLALLEGEYKSLVTPKAKTLLKVIGVPADKVALLVGKIPEYREDLKKGDRVLQVLPQIAAIGGRKTYLLVFQNSAELRPTGGFIGSYAVVHFDHGRILDYKINDIYTADGQLRGRIAPPDEILHFLGQPSWFMRDANFAADFPLTASRLEWFLEKETGQVVDGVVALDLGAIQKILSATGPLPLADFKEDVTAANLFNKAEFQSEINFFPGSSQKRDYLGAVAQAILEKATNDSRGNFLSLSQAIMGALASKNIMVYFNDQVSQNIMEVNGWAGSIVEKDCGMKGTNCLMWVEANFGANKANYYLTRQMKVRAEVGKGGKVVTTVTVTYVNNSPSNSWPGGMYKNYFRLLVPPGSELMHMDIGDGRKASVSGVLTAEVLAKVNPNQFLVFKSQELALGEGVATQSAFESFGAVVEVPIKSTKTVTATYLSNYMMDFTQERPEFNLAILKQPGTQSDPLSLEVEYPAFLQPGDVEIRPKEENEGAIVFPQRLLYNMDLRTDRVLKVTFNKQ